MTRMSAPPQTGLSPPRRECLNCGATLAGHYCVHCGQAADIHVPSTRELLHEALEGITHSDSRLWRTLFHLWFKPGMLTREFIAGRRMAYLPPFRLYLVVSVIFFLIASVSEPHSALLNSEDSVARSAAAQKECADWHFAAGGRDWGERIRHACFATLSDHGTNLLHVAVGTMPKAMFIFLPLIAFLHMLMYWRPRHRYVVHLLFFLHAHAFFFSLMAAVLVCTDAADAWPRLQFGWDYVPWVFLSMALYTCLAMKRVFGRGWTGTLLKAVALFAVYSVVLSITLAGVFVYAAMQL